MPDITNLEGEQVEGWILKSILGRGADGIVFEGEKSGKAAAVKIFFPESIERNGFAEAKLRVELQLRLKGKKSHPNLVEIIDGGETSIWGNVTLFLIMELVPGNPLDKVLQKLPSASIPSLIKQLAAAAQFLEDQDLVHRDIKPANIMISEDFTRLTLLDLGVAIATDKERLSGEEFVGTIRYSPPEFVSRTEDTSEPGAWRAVTYYQIGATLHDMIMRRPLFQGYDKPRAKLYDSVKFHSPEIESQDCEPWLNNLAKRCLVKNWRERLRLVNWASFSGPLDNDPEFAEKQREIRLRQLRKDELRILAESQKAPVTQNTRIQELWDLHNKVFMELRQFLMDSPIFPKCSATHSQFKEDEYLLQFRFEKDSQLMFESPISIEIVLAIDPDFPEATKLKFAAMSDGVAPIYNATWTELLSVESASSMLRQALIQTADKLTR